MKAFQCSCGSRLFFENSHCLQCGSLLGFDPGSQNLYPLIAGSEGNWFAENESGKQAFRLCKNRTDHQICNWLVPAYEQNPYCLACRMNEMIPSLEKDDNHALWASMEDSKRRLLYTLLCLELPVVAMCDAPGFGLGFAFLEDQRRNRAVKPDYVMTGHSDGLITVNLIEADSAFREAVRKQFSEPYRTLLGHFRHESGHYYWNILIQKDFLSDFRALFGDERDDYQAALDRYHANLGQAQPGEAYISRYASVHPYEDWAETWAHYLHMVDTLETAAALNIAPFSVAGSGFGEMLERWVELSIMMNSLNRSMGLSDACPFVLTGPVKAKLGFVHRLLAHAPWTTGFAADQETPL